MAKKYEPTYRAILEQIAGGLVVHADETKGVVYGGGHYVWVFANLTSVAYTSKGTTDYCVLLSLQQTLRCRGISFLDFLRSGRTEIDN